jgi:hypothetical protein
MNTADLNQENAATAKLNTRPTPHDEDGASSKLFRGLFSGKRLFIALICG